MNPMAMLSMMVQNNPQMARYWSMAQQMTQGKSPQEIQTIAQNLAKQRGIDMAQVNQMIQQFTGGMKF